MHETPEDLQRLQTLLDRSHAAGGPHLRSIVTDARRPDAAEVCRRLHGMRLLTVATATADGRPLTAPADGYLLHGEWHFSVGGASVRARHLRRRPAVSATHLPDDAFAVTVHGTAELYDLHDRRRPELRAAMLEHYLPRQGPDFERWLDELDGIAVRIDAARVISLRM